MQPENPMSPDRLKYLAHFAEIISGVAVVVTLIFLVFEVRENSELVRANTFNRNIESLIDLRMEIVSNDDSLRVMAEHWGLDDIDLFRRQLFVVSMWSIYEKTYYSHQYGLIGPAEWERFETRICIYSESKNEFWQDNVANFLTDEFRSYVTAHCANDIAK